MKKTIAFVLAMLVSSVILFLQKPEIGSADQMYRKWKSDFGFSFEGVEDLYRMKIFLERLKGINAHNSLLGRTYDEGINQFSALTQQEFAKTYLTQIKYSKVNVVVQKNNLQANGPAVDWVSYGAVSPVKDQGSCTASYAFSAVGAIQGYSKIFYNYQMEYSVQQLIDCTLNYGNSGCVTGTMINCFDFVGNSGITTQALYPYSGFQGFCRYSGGNFRISGYASINSGDCVNLANAILYQPISVAVDGYNFQNYQFGIFSNCDTNLSLAVTLVGMTDTFWNLKNSWGTRWGQNGYIRIARGNTCGVCYAASYPL